jgi:hypothetical protein
MKLYEITEQFRKLDDFIPEIDSEEQAQAYTELFDWLQGTLEEKIEGLCAVIANADAESVALKAEIDRLTKRKRASEAKVDRLKDYMKFELDRMQQKQVKTGVWSVTVQDNPPSCKVDESSLSDSWWKVERKPDISKVKDALKAGEKVDGAWLERTRSVRIR